MPHRFNIEQRIRLIEARIKTVDAYSEEVYRIGQEIAQIFEEILSFEVACIAPEKSLNQLEYLEQMLNEKIDKKETVESILGQIDFD